MLTFVRFTLERLLVGHSKIDLGLFASLAFPEHKRGVFCGCWDSSTSQGAPWFAYFRFHTSEL